MAPTSSSRASRSRWRRPGSTRPSCARCARPPAASRSRPTPSSLNGGTTSGLEALLPGDSLQLMLSITPGWEGVREAVGGREFIVRDGMTDISPRPALADQLHPADGGGDHRGRRPGPGDRRRAPDRLQHRRRPSRAGRADAVARRGPGAEHGRRRLDDDGRPSPRRSRDHGRQPPLRRPRAGGGQQPGGRQLRADRPPGPHRRDAGDGVAVAGRGGHLHREGAGRRVQRGGARPSARWHGASSAPARSTAPAASRRPGRARPR